MLSRAPGIRIGLANVIMCGLIQVIICQRWTLYVSNHKDSDAPSWELLA